MPHRIEILEYGSPDVLQLRAYDLPEPKDDEVVVKTAFSPVNRADIEIRSGNWKVNQGNPFPYTPGLEVIGNIYSLGANVKLKIGTPVITMMQKLGGIHGVRPGGYQEYVTVPANTLAHLPEGVNLEIVSALGLAAVTAFSALKKLFIQKGDRVLIMGASGGVGSNAVQMAKAEGAYVIATTRGRDTGPLETLGVDEIWDTTQRPISVWCKNNRVDAVLEMAGGRIFGECVGALKRFGRLCSVGALTGGEASLSIWDLTQDLQLTGWSSENLNQEGLQKALDSILNLLENQKIKPPPYQIRPLAEAAMAHQALEKSTHTGRILLRPY